MFTLPSKTRICFRMFVCVPSSFKTCRLRTNKTISQAHLMNWVNWAKKWTSLQKKMLCFLENEGKKRRLQINIPSRNVFSMPLVEKSILTVSLRFQMMTTTFVSEINYYFYNLSTLVMFLQAGLLRLLHWFESWNQFIQLQALFTRWVHLSCSVRDRVSTYTLKVA